MLKGFSCDAELIFNPLLQPGYFLMLYIRIPDQDIRQGIRPILPAVSDPVAFEGAVRLNRSLPFKIHGDFSLWFNQPKLNKEVNKMSYKNMINFDNFMGFYKSQFVIWSLRIFSFSH